MRLKKALLVNARVSKAGDSHGEEWLVGRVQTCEVGVSGRQVLKVNGGNYVPGELIRFPLGVDAVCLFTGKFYLKPF